MAVDLARRHELELSSVRGTMAFYGVNALSCFESKPVFDFNVFGQALEIFPSTERLSFLLSDL